MKRRIADTSSFTPDKRQRTNSGVPVSKWSACTETLAAHYRTKEQQHEKKLAVKAKWETFDGMEHVAIATEVKRRLDIIKQAFLFNFEPSYQQEQLYNYAITTILPHIMGRRYEMSKAVILQELKEPKLFADVHYITPRQFGKTTCVSQLAKAIGKHVPIFIAIFSTGKRTAENLMKLLQKAIEADPEMRPRLRTNNTERIEVNVIPLDPEDEGKYSTIRAFPANGNSKYSPFFYPPPPPLPKTSTLK